MSKTNEQRWQENYDQLMAYVLERLVRQGKLSPERTELLRQLSNLRNVRELWP